MLIVNEMFVWRMDGTAAAIDDMRRLKDKRLLRARWDGSHAAIVFCLTGEREMEVFPDLAVGRDAQFRQSGIYDGLLIGR